MLFGPISAIDESRIRELIGMSESVTLEFKRELPGKDERSKSELLKDVSAMANTLGGDIVFGIDEKEGTAAAITPISGEPFDAAQRRMRQVLDAIEPRLDTLQFKEVALATADGYALILRVAQSYSGPHRYLLQGNQRFVLRDGSRIIDMTYDQLRTAFDRNATLTERAREFREKRLQRIGSGQAWREMEPGPLCIFHAIPIGSMTGRVAVDVAATYQQYSGLMLKHWSGASRSLNLDGLLAYSPTRQGLSDYTMLFRTGTVEIVSVVGSESEGEKWLASTYIGEFVREAIEVSTTTLRRQGIGGPAICGVALLHVSGYMFGLGGSRRFFQGSPTADRENLVLPETWVEDISACPATDVIAKPMLDVLWQAFDLTHCFNYDDAGEWSRE